MVWQGKILGQREFYTGAVALLLLSYALISYFGIFACNVARTGIFALCKCNMMRDLLYMYVYFGDSSHGEISFSLNFQISKSHPVIHVS